MGTTKGTTATTDRSQGKWLDGHYHQGSTLPETLVLSLPLGVCAGTLTSGEANYLFFFFGHKAYGIFPDQGLNSCPLCWKCRILTTGPPGKSRKLPCYDALGLGPNTAGEKSFKRVRISQASPSKQSSLCPLAFSDSKKGTIL